MVKYFDVKDYEEGTVSAVIHSNSPICLYSENGPPTVLASNNGRGKYYVSFFKVEGDAKSFIDMAVDNIDLPAKGPSYLPLHLRNKFGFNGSVPDIFVFKTNIKGVPHIAVCRGVNMKHEGELVHMKRP